jgi:uncharacterized repeat protein (TIGR03803 family)
LRFNLPRNICVLFLVCIAIATSSFAQSSTAATFTTLVSFNGTNGPTISQPLVQGFDGNLYGTAGGSSFFRLTPAGTLTTFGNSAPNSNDSYPFLSVVGTDGNLYGTSSGGGALYGGTVFQLTPQGQLNTLYDFSAEDSTTGGDPLYGVIQATDGNYYGATSEAPFARSTIFKITPAGVLTTLYTYDPTSGTALSESSGPLIEDIDGAFFGVDANAGAVFTFSPGGVPTTVHRFCMLANCADGGLDGSLGLVQTLVQDLYGNLYGETQVGGTANPENCLWSECGTIFRMTPNGRVRTIYNFCSEPIRRHRCPDGQLPTGNLTVGSDGNFYGITLLGGTFGRGTIFRVTSSGTMITLHNFAATDGVGPSGLVQATNGSFYGAMAGSEDGRCCGSIYSLSVGLPSFVKTLPTIGNVGGTVVILGNDLTSASSVTFNGIPAAFTVVSDTEITATVPTGATTGAVEVTISNGTLKSNTAFQVGIAPTGTGLFGGHGD